MLDKKILKLARIADSDGYDRKKVGYFSGLTGICLNLGLGVTKLLVGILANSIAIIADATNNFADAISSFATVLGFKLSSAPPDQNHPYGHGRIEYITTLIISMLIMLVGFQFIKTSIGRILSPEKIVLNATGIILLLVSILIKLWLSIFNKKLAKAIDSGILKATSTDCLNDVLVTAVVLGAMIGANYTSLPIDGIVGIPVSIFILFSGFGLAKETVSELIGEAPSKEFVKKIAEEIGGYDGVLGIHHLTFHKYGHWQTISTADVEVRADMSLVKAHNLITVIEKEIMEKYGISLIIHIDPIGGNYTRRELELKNLVANWAKQIEFIKSIHDFAIYQKDEGEFLGMEIYLDGNKLKKDFEKERLTDEFDRFIKSLEPELNTSVVVFVEYVQLGDGRF